MFCQFISLTVMRGSTVWPQNESSQILSVPLVFFYQLSIDFVVDFNGLDGCEKSTIDEKLSWMKCNRNTIGETNWLFAGFEILFCTILEIQLLWFVFLLFSRILETVCDISPYEEGFYENCHAVTVLEVRIPDCPLLRIPSWKQHEDIPSNSLK